MQSSPKYYNQVGLLIVSSASRRPARCEQGPVAHGICMPARDVEHDVASKQPPICEYIRADMPADMRAMPRPAPPPQATLFWATEAALGGAERPHQPAFAGVQHPLAAQPTVTGLVPLSSSIAS